MVCYDLNFKAIYGIYYSPQEMTGMELSADIYIDPTSIEVFIDDGACSYSMERKPYSNNKEGFHFWGNHIEVKELQVFSAESIWD